MSFMTRPMKTSSSRAGLNSPVSQRSCDFSSALSGSVSMGPNSDSAARSRRTATRI